MMKMGFPGGASGKEPTCQCRRHKETRVQSLDQVDPLEEGMITHSSSLAWRIPCTEEPGGLQSMGLQSMGLQKVWHDLSDLACTRTKSNTALLLMKTELMQDKRRGQNTEFFECIRSCFSCVWLLAIPWMVACQAPLSVGFSREEYWNRLPCPSTGIFSSWPRDQSHVSYVSCTGRQLFTPSTSW